MDPKWQTGNLNTTCLLHSVNCGELLGVVVNDFHFSTWEQRWKDPEFKASQDMRCYLKRLPRKRVAYQTYQKLMDRDGGLHM